MTKIKKSLSEKESALLKIINDAKNKLTKLQDKQRNEIGDLACKNGLNEFDTVVLDKAFKKIYSELTEKK